MSAQIARRLFTVADYYQMAKSGIFSEDDRVELMDGEIHEMCAVDAIHSAIVNRLNNMLNSRVGERFIISVQDPIRLNDLTEPQPDLAILRWHDDFYEQEHPTPGDVLVVVEVSNSSLNYDRTEKLPRYAAAGIPEVWLVNLERQCVEQYTQPEQDEYSIKRIVRRGAMLTSKVVDDLQLPIDRIFGF